MKKIKLLMFIFIIFIAFICFGNTTVQADFMPITTTEDMLQIVFQNYQQPEDSPNASLVDGVITLNKDYDTANCGYVVSGNYKINLNGHTIRYNQTSGNSFLSIGSGSSIEIGDSTNTTGGISTTGYLRASYLFSVDGGSLTINNGTYTNTASNSSYGVGIVQVNSGTVTINGGTFTTCFDNNVMITGGDITINNGTFLGAEKSIVACSTNNSIKSITINNGTFTSRTGGEECLAFQFNQLTGIRINGGKFTGDSHAFLYYDENENTTVTTEEISAIIGANSKVTGEIELTKIYYKYSTLKGFVSGKTSEVKQKNKYDIVLTANATGGTISVADLKPFEESSVAINIQPVSGYKLKEIKILKYIDDSDVTNSLSYNITDNTFTMPNYSIKIIPEFELIQSEKTIAETEDNMIISVKGTFSGTPELIITKTEKGNEGYNSLITLVKEDKEIIGSYDISITGGAYEGELILTFTVGEQYEGDTITIYHKKVSGEIETLETILKDGKATITVDELSPFMLVTDKKTIDKEALDKEEIDKEVAAEEIVEKKDETPKTGVKDNIYIYTVFIIIAIIGIIPTNKLMKKNR